MAPGKPRVDLIELGLQDEWLHAVTYVEVGPQGERVDKRDYLSHWEETIRSAAMEDPIIRKVRDGDLLTPEEETSLAERLNSPEYRQPWGNLIDFVKAALGTIHLKTREEVLTENFQAWLVAKSLTPQQAQYLSLLKNRGIASGKIEVEDLFKPPLSILNAAGLGVELFGEKGIQNIIEDLNDSVFSRKLA